MTGMEMSVQARAAWTGATAAQAAGQEGASPLCPPGGGAFTPGIFEARKRRDSKGRTGR